MFVCSLCSETFEGDGAGDKYADHLTDEHDAYTRLAVIDADAAGVAR